MNSKSIKRILLVEDNPGDAHLLREMLNEEGAYRTELTLVGRMQDAESHLTNHEIDIILLDLGLPDAEGLEALRRIRAVAPRVSVVVLTGRDEESLCRLSAKRASKHASGWMRVCR